MAGRFHYPECILRGDCWGPRGVEVEIGHADDGTMTLSTEYGPKHAFASVDETECQICLVECECDLIDSVLYRVALSIWEAREPYRLYDLGRSERRTARMSGGARELMMTIPPRQEGRPTR